MNTFRLLTPVLALLVSSLALSVINDQRYSPISSTQLSNNYTQLLWTDDMTVGLLYGQSSQLANVFKGYNWQPTTIPAYSSLGAEPKFMSTFTNKLDQKHNFLYGNEQGQIYRKWIFGQKQTVIVRLWTVEDEEQQIAKVLPSPDQRFFAAICQNSGKVYIGDLDTQQSIQRELNYTGVVTSIQWIPGSTKLAIAGGELSGDTYLLIYDYDLQTEQYLTHITDSLLLDLAISEDGNMLYFIQDGSEAQYFKLKTYDFTTEQTNTPYQSDIRQFLGVSVKGNFVYVWDGQSVYVFHRPNHEYYGNYKSTLTTNGLSPDGSTLAVLDNSKTILTLYALCSQKGTVYEPASNNCIDCVQCQTCFLKTSQCSSCPMAYYLTPEYTCSSCAQKLIACTECSNASYCTNCDQSRHRTLDFIGHRCICMQRYLEVENECLRCPAHCLRCLNVDNCYTCDEKQHWTINNGQCVCMEGWTFSNNTGTCLSCSSAISHCQTCQSPFICTKCEEGFDLDSDQHDCQQPSGHVTLFIIVGVAVVVFAIGVFVVYKFVRRRNVRRSLVETEGGEYAIE